MAACPDIRPGCLELEVLETSALDDMLHVSQIMEACLAIGVSFALDDFGTGYSSLTYLKRLPAKHLKIDRSFVGDMLNDPDDLAILEGILGLATAFRKQPIAEGVESAEHGKLLLQLGCELAQGFVIARPMPADALPGWVNNWQPPASWRSEKTVSVNDLSTLFIGIEHRAWVRAIEECIRHERVKPPPFKQDECRLGQWLQGEGKRRYESLEAYDVILPLHSKVHELGAELYELQAQGKQQEALGRLPELHDLRDRLLIQLEVLLRVSGP